MKQIKEPGSLFFWSAVFILLFVIVPYGFIGESQPRLWNLPIWFHVSLVATIVVSLLSPWRIWRSWRVEGEGE